MAILNSCDVIKIVWRDCVFVERQGERCSAEEVAFAEGGQYVYLAGSEPGAVANRKNPTRL